jgi:hypothetical protein
MVMIACYRWSVMWVSAMVLTLLSISPSFGFDPFWSPVLTDWGLSASGLHLSVLSFAPERGLQLATVTALDHRGKGLQFGLGYDDMVSESRVALDRLNLPLAVSDQIFVSTTRCDKRFQFTLEIRW